MILRHKRILRHLIGDGPYRSLSELKVRVRHLLRWTVGLDPRVRPNRPRTLRVERCGEWFVCPALVPPGAVVYSIGIGKDLSFDLTLIKHFGAQVFAFDPTPDAVAWVRAQRLPSTLKVRELGIASYDGSANFSANTEQGNPSFSFVAGGVGTAVRCEVRRLKTLMTAEGHRHINLLKLDVEGAEYEVLADIILSGISIGQLLVEFHHRKLPKGSLLTRQAVDDLQAHGFRLVHVSPGGQEFLFVSQVELDVE